jgi:hypothetical protein
VTVQSVVCVNGGGDSHGPIVTRGSVKWVTVGSLKPASSNNPTNSVGGNITTQPPLINPSNQKETVYEAGDKAIENVATSPRYRGGNRA